MKLTRNSLNQLITEELTKLILEMDVDINPDDYDCSDPRDWKALGYKSEKECDDNIERDYGTEADERKAAAEFYQRAPTNADLRGVMQMLQQIDTKLSTLLSTKGQR